MKLMLFIICALMVLLTACDNREGEKPTLTVDTGTQPLYNVANHDTVNIVCQLAGDESVTANQQIDVIYESSKGLFVGSGSSNYLMTDGNGFAQGFFKVHDGYYGDIAIKFSPTHFPEKAKTITLVAQDMPKITTFTVEDSTLSIDDPAYTGITVLITSHSQNIMNQMIHFSTTHGSLESTSLQTGSEGVAVNVFHRNGFVGDAVISTYIEIYPEDIHYITVHCE